MENRTRNLLLRIMFNLTRVDLFIVLYILPIIFLWFFDNEKDFIKYFFDVNFVLNFLLVGISLIGSNYISLKIFRKIEKKLYSNE